MTATNPLPIRFAWAAVLSLAMLAVLARAAPVSENRAVPAFRAIAVRGAVDLVVRQAGAPAVQVRADDKLLPMIETRVVDRAGVPTLEIVAKTGWRIGKGAVVTVDAVALESLAISGSADASVEALRTPRLAVAVAGAGDLRLIGLAADELAVKVSGSGDVLASGKAGRLSIAIVGSGDVTTRDLAADEVRVSIAGSGDVAVNAQKSLAVSIAGSGDVHYTGAATVQQSIAGSGSVTKLP